MGSGRYPLLPLVGLTQALRQGAAGALSQAGEMDWPGKTLQGCSIAEKSCASKVGRLLQNVETGTQGGSQGRGWGMGESEGAWGGEGQGPLTLLASPPHEGIHPISCSWQGPRGGWAGWRWTCSEALAQAELEKLCFS